MCLSLMFNLNILVTMLSIFIAELVSLEGIFDSYSQGKYPLMKQRVLGPIQQIEPNNVVLKHIELTLKLSQTSQWWKRTRLFQNPSLYIFRFGCSAKTTRDQNYFHRYFVFSFCQVSNDKSNCYCRVFLAFIWWFWYWYYFCANKLILFICCFTNIFIFGINCYSI